MYNDEINGGIFAVDDYSLKRIFFNGSTVEFQHTSDYGYDVDGIDDDHELLWTDQNGDRGVRYLVTHDVETPSDQQKAVEQSNTP